MGRLPLVSYLQIGRARSFLSTPICCLFCIYRQLRFDLKKIFSLKCINNMNPFTTGNIYVDSKIDEWFQWNKNEKQNEEVRKLLKNKEKNEIEKLFLKRVEFGTAGLRGRMGPGFSQMNELVIIQTAQGFLSYLASDLPDSLRTRGIVIGYDGRHFSRRFAELTAGIFLNWGSPVYMFSQVCPTPFVPFAITKYHCVAGVMVTASHNPKEDNGYKVFWGNGAQIVSPIDKKISEWIEKRLAPDEISWQPEKSLNNFRDKLVDPLEEVTSSYFKMVSGRVHDMKLNWSAPFKITYTAMHGVGYPFVKRIFKETNFQEIIPVIEQVEVDPEFSTVKFPNPEEGKSSLDLSFKTADCNNSIIILANDPDADRLALAEKSRTTNEWKVFTGNEMGALIGWWEIFCFKQKNPSPKLLEDCYLISSTVSSKILRTMANAESLKFEETLTGFKWMGNKADALMKEGKHVLFAYEEAIGFMCGTGVLDKDGVSAAVRVAELASYIYQVEQTTLAEKLKAIYKKYGQHISNNSYYICYQPEVIKKIFDRLRNFGEHGKYPSEICNGKYKIIGVRDLTTGYDSSKPNKKATLPTSASSQMITFTFDNGLVATLRTSGTEPKIKYYTELCASPDNQNIDELKETLSEMVEDIITNFLQPKLNGLIEKSS